MCGVPCAAQYVLGAPHAQKETPARCYEVAPLRNSSRPPACTPLVRGAPAVQWVNMNILRLLKLFIALLLFSHWNGCMQYFLATFDTTVVTLDPSSNLTAVRMHDETWVVRAQIDPVTEPLAIMRWSWSFYQAMTQLLAISVGIVEPRRPAELWVNLISILCGAALYAIFVGMRRGSPSLHRAQSS